MTETPPPADGAAPRRRRPRYRGTHPRRFEEKYKELDPSRYPTEREKAEERGGTAAGSHRPVMRDEVLAALGPLAGRTVLDCTLGYGGHAEALARAVGPAGRVIALDRDADELARTTARLAALGLPVEPRHANFAGAAKEVRAAGAELVDAVMADLGVSSMQLDRPERGLSFRTDGPLDMRMDRTRGETAADLLVRLSEDDLRDVLATHGDEPDAAAVAAAIRRRVDAGSPPRTTWELASVVQEAKGRGPGRFRKRDAFDVHPATRSFQALRIAVNREHEALAALLRDLPWMLAPGGRAALLTFHSGEERAVGRSLADGLASGVWAEICAEPARPSGDEVRANPRARSARLWRAVRAHAPD